MSIAEHIAANVVMPNPAYAAHWDAIIGAPERKGRLLHHALLAWGVRGRIPFETSAVHGLAVLLGPPGTGKTTMARGLACAASQVVAGRQVRFLEVHPHGLMSSEHGQTQQMVSELLLEHLPELAADGLPTIVVLDEVESMAVARSAASLSANPADVHRATDAVLTALDKVSREHSHVIFVATSNFTEALDEAFVSRADVAVEVPLPEPAAIQAILVKTLTDFAAAYPKLAKLADAPGLETVARRLKGADGRRVRKVVTTALAVRR